jgi:hypothetical protein
MMKKMVILILPMIFTSLALSQSISRQVIGPSGKTFSNSNLKVSFSVSEPVVGLMTANGAQLGNGYYPALDLQALNLEDDLVDVKIKLFPNPTSNSIYIIHPTIQSFRIIIFDLNGKKMFEGDLNNNVPFDISNYTQGMYLLTVENVLSNKKNTYKILKK